MHIKGENDDNKIEVLWQGLFPLSSFTDIWPISSLLVLELQAIITLSIQNNELFLMICTGSDLS